MSCTLQQEILAAENAAGQAERGSRPYVIVIVNAAAGGGYTSERAADLVDRFRQAGLNAEVALAADGDQIVALARSAVEAPAEKRPAAVVAGGGDGTLNAVASVLVGSRVALGVLPLGTLNHFAKDVGIPLEAEAAIDNIGRGCVVPVDVGEVNGRIFINNSSLGIYPDIVRARERQQRRLGTSKWLAFARATWSALHRYTFMRVRVFLPQQSLQERTPFVFVGNNEYQMEGLNLGGRKRLDGGMLCVYLAQRTGPWGLVRLALRALLGKLQGANELRVMTTTEMTVATHRRKLRVATDGEVTLLTTPLHYRIRPGALRVIVPQAAARSEKPASD